VSGPRLVLVAARGRNGVIGSEGDLPWRIPSDLKRFKAVTLGKPLVMGRKTWDSLPRKPLPGRANIVVSRTVSALEGAEVFASPQAALDAARAAARETGAGEVCVIGGAALYAALIGQADRLYLTEVDLAPSGEARFPAIDEAEWTETAREEVAAGEGDDAGFVLRTLDRRR
jgi:dihydrofolate reductase